MPTSEATTVIRAGEPIFVLCGVRNTIEWPDKGLVEAQAWNPDMRSLDGIFGLAWGVGDPLFANLDEIICSIVKVDEFVEVKSRGGTVAVKFQSGFVVFRGDLRTALERMVHLGADPDKMAIKVCRAGEDKLAVAEAWGIALAPENGVALAAANGRAEAGGFGKAIAKNNGRARVGDFGLAFVEETGESKAGFGGIAIVAGEKDWRGFGSASAGDAGLAVAYHRATSGSKGVSVARGFNRDSRASVDEDGVAIGGQVSGGLGSLLVARECNDLYGRPSYAVGVVGQGGIEPYAQYRALDGRLGKPDGGAKGPAPTTDELRTAATAIERFLDRITIQSPEISEFGLTYQARLKRDLLIQCIGFCCGSLCRAPISEAASHAEELERLIAAVLPLTSIKSIAEEMRTLIHSYEQLKRYDKAQQWRRLWKQLELEPNT